MDRGHHNFQPLLHWPGDHSLLLRAHQLGFKGYIRVGEFIAKYRLCRVQGLGCDCAMGL